MHWISGIADGNQSRPHRCRLHICQQCQPHHVYAKKHDDLFRQKRAKAQRGSRRYQEGEKDYRKPLGHGNGGQLWKQETALCRWAHQGTQHVLRNIATILRNPYGKCRPPCRRADGQGHEEGSLKKNKVVLYRPIGRYERNRCAQTARHLGFLRTKHIKNSSKNICQGIRMWHLSTSKDS